MQNRREFLGALGATAALASWGAARPEAESFGAERLRLAVLADIHISDEHQQPYFERALRAFDDWGCDGVLACGDLADHGLKEQLALVAETWFKVFPDGKGKDGRPVANLMHYGDHDMSVSYGQRPEVRKLLAGADPMPHFLHTGDNRKRAWEECFGEKYEPIMVKTVKGYAFVLYHFDRDVRGRGNGAPGLEAVLKNLKFDPSKPLFYSQHRPIQATNYLHAGDNGETTALFSKIPNLIAFTGHCHIPATEERSIWQGEFTSIQVPSLRYSWTRGGRENSYSELDRPALPPYKLLPELSLGAQVANQGLFCTVYERALVIRRWNFSNQSSLGPDWVLPFDSFSMPPAAKPFAFAVRAKTVGIPQFGASAQVTVKFSRRSDRGGNQRECFDVEFPAAKAANGHPAANDYSVRLELQTAELERVLLEKRVYGRQYVIGDRDEAPVVCPFSVDEVPKGCRLRFVVRPLNTFDGAGAALVTPWEFRSWGKTPAEAAEEARAIIAEARRPKGPMGPSPSCQKAK